MKILAHSRSILVLATLGSTALFGQQPGPTGPPGASVSVIPIPVPQPTVNALPKLLVSTGGGYAMAGGGFAYLSESTLILPQQTYATVAQEYTIVHGKVNSCTFGGLTKPLYQFSVVTIGLTGLGGGCTNSTGDSTGAASGQGFVHFRWGRLPVGTVITAMKDSNSKLKITLGFSWGEYP